MRVCACVRMFGAMITHVLWYTTSLLFWHSSRVLRHVHPVATRSVRPGCYRWLHQRYTCHLDRSPSVVGCRPRRWHDRWDDWCCVGKCARQPAHAPPESGMLNLLAHPAAAPAAAANIPPCMLPVCAVGPSVGCECPCIPNVYRRPHCLATVDAIWCRGRCRSHGRCVRAHGCIGGNHRHATRLV